MVAIPLPTLLRVGELVARLEREGKPMGAIDSLPALARSKASKCWQRKIKRIFKTPG